MIFSRQDFFSEIQARFCFSLEGSKLAHWTNLYSHQELGICEKNHCSTNRSAGLCEIVEIVTLKYIELFWRLRSLRLTTEWNGRKICTR